MKIMNLLMLALIASACSSMKPGSIEQEQFQSLTKASLATPK